MLRRAVCFPFRSKLAGLGKSVGIRWTTTTSVDGKIEGTGEEDSSSTGVAETNESTRETTYQKGVSSLTPEQLYPLWTTNNEWTKRTYRTGVLAVKCGHIGLWNAKGERIHCTVVCIDRCFVTDTSRMPKNSKEKGLWTTAVGGGVKVPFAVKKSQRYQFAAVGIEPKVKIRSFKTSENALLAPGTELTALHFRAGQHVDVRGTTKGKGFQGVMKKWGFKGQPASHGVTKAHRSLGSTGTRKIKTKPGRKMPGRMGGRNATSRNLMVYKVDGINNLLYLKGNVPGRAGRFVTIKDSFFSRTREGPSLPLPTRFLTGNEPAEDLIQTADGENRHVKEAQLYFNPPPDSRRVVYDEDHEEDPEEGDFDHR